MTAWKYYLGIALTLFLLGWFFDDLRDAFVENVNASALSKRIQRRQDVATSSHVTLPDLRTTQCLSYLELVASVNDFDANRSEDALTLLRQTPICEGEARRKLLLPLESMRLATTGRYYESCAVLSQIDAQIRMVEVAETAAQAEDWKALVAYLDCIDNNGMPPNTDIRFRVAPLFLELGQHYEEAGQPEEALQAYAQASDWYPVRWSAPVVARVRILLKQDRPTEAERVLQAAAVKPGDQVNLFLIFREIIPVWKAEGKNESAYCIYKEAERLLPLIPAAMNPAALEENLKTRIGTIQNTLHPDAEGCTQLLAGWLTPQ